MVPPIARLLQLECCPIGAACIDERVSQLDITGCQAIPGLLA